MQASGHGGELNSAGCHNDHKTGGYHCYRSLNKTASSGSTNSSAIILRDEDQYNDFVAKQLQGEREVRLHYTVPETANTGYIVIDIMTDEYVIEGGLDKRSSLDSVQQAAFAAALTGKKPVIIIYDTDATFGKYEHRIRIAAKSVGMAFFWWSQGGLREG
ncbi:MAG: hypothetical protein AAF352_01860 [Pseudomonadota bacterium]